MYPRLVWSQIKRHCGQQSKALGWFFGSSEMFPSVAMYWLILVFICLFVSFSVFVLSAVILIHHSFKFNQIITKCSCQSVAHGRRELGFVTEGHLTVFFCWSLEPSSVTFGYRSEKRTSGLNDGNLWSTMQHRRLSDFCFSYLHLLLCCSYCDQISVLLNSPAMSILLTKTLFLKLVLFL